MAKIIVGLIEDFFIGETVEITVLCKKAGVAQDITGDIVTLTMKENKADADASAILQENADVATYGATGTAYWDLTPAKTEVIAVGSYFMDIVWYDGSKEHVVYDKAVKVKERVSDIT